ncbi:MAG: SUMF1/EgtB/PvdO family nonheme iron enzyme [Planctomycetaceae bacterium]
MKIYFCPCLVLTLLVANLKADTGDEHPVVNSVGMELIPIPAGSFRMGSDHGHWNECPIHTVTISRPFLISKFEVTRVQFLQFRSGFDSTATKKAMGATWFDAVAFCEWLSEKEGRPYRLPTEAEWEYACRLEGQTEDSKLVGMLDDVVEWCQDWYGPYSDQDEIDPTGAKEGMVRVLRGDKLDVDDKTIVPWSYNRAAYRAGMPPTFGRPHIEDPNVSFRVVQAPPVTTPPREVMPEFFRLGVKQSTGETAMQHAPDPARPYFRKRYMIATPPETWEGNHYENPIHKRKMDFLGLHPGLGGHQHSPALEVLSNGDLLLVTYSAWTEYNPELALMAIRLRYGHDQWEMPSFGFDLPGVNDHAPLLWTDGHATHLFWGSPKLPMHVAFQWTTTYDSGANWEPVRFPELTGSPGIGGSQPINTAFRDRNGTIFISCDGAENSAESLLWASDDGMKTWRDPGGRTNGVHSIFALLSDGESIFALNGRKTHLDYYMTTSTSHDHAQSFTTGKSPFAWGGSNQRPSLLRLRSGRLLAAIDMVNSRDPSPPEFEGMQGSFIAVSDDDGMTWRRKRLPGGQLHETRKERGFGTIGYSVLRQGPNGMIHLVTSMTEPCLHFTFNEAWVDLPEQADEGDANLMASTAHRISAITKHKEHYANGQLRQTWSAGIGDDGRYLLHGPEKWFYPDGTLQYEASFSLGKKDGGEILYRSDGSKVWDWQHLDDGSSVWTQYRPDGSRRTESRWKDLHVEGIARRWDADGNLTGEEVYSPSSFVRNPNE